MSQTFTRCQQDRHVTPLKILLRYAAQRENSTPAFPANTLEAPEGSLRRLKSEPIGTPEDRIYLMLYILARYYERST